MADQNVGIVITATDKTMSAFKSVEGSLGRLSTGFTKIHGLIGLIAGATGGGFLALTKQSIEFADSIAKVSDKIGLTTNSLQELRFAAERSGVSQGALDMAMQRFSRRVGEAALGSGELVKTLDQYGIKVRDSEGKMRSLEDILADYANTIKGAESDQEKLRLAFKAFDAEGAKLVNMLRGGADGLNDLKVAAVEAGAVMDESLIRKAEHINDRWDTLTNTLGVKFKSALITAADASLKFFGIYSSMDDITNDLAKANLRLAQAEETVARIRKEGGIYSGEAIAEWKMEIADTKNTIQDLEEQAQQYIKMQERLDAMTSGVILPNVVNTSIKSQKEKDKPDDNTQDDAHVQDYENYQQYLTDRVEALRVSLLSESELENERFQQQIENLQNAKDLEIETKISYWELEQELLSQHIEALNDITYRGLDINQRFAVAFQKGDLRNIAKYGNEMLQSVSGNNKVLFELNKGFALSNAAVSLPSAVLDSFKNGGGYPWGLVPAGLMLAKGLALISQISSASYGGGNSASGTSIGGGGGSASYYETAPPAPTEPPISADTEKSTLTVQFLGDVYGLEDFQDTVIRTIRDAVTDKDEIIIRANSRQAVELR